MTENSLETLTRSLGYHVGSKGRSASTEIHYKAALRRFHCWMGEHGIRELRDVQPTNVEHYMTDLRATGLRPATLRYQFAGLQAVFTWHSQREGYRSPMKDMRGPRVPEVQKDVVELADLHRVVNGLHRRRQYRDAALVSVLAETGVRVSEACKLTWKSINFKAKELTVTDTKNGDVRVIPLLDGTMERLDIMHDGINDGGAVVFRGQRGPLTRSGVEQLIRRVFEEAGITGISPHDLRHTWATHFMDQNPHGSEILKVIGGWRSDTMVARYSKKGREARAREAFRASTPIRL